jgi:hypothetical protein
MRYIVVTFALCLLVTSAQAGTYMHNFDDGDLDSCVIFDFLGGVSEWKIEDGILTCRRTIAPSSSLLYGEESWGDYSIECDAKMVETFANFHAIALDLRVSNIGNANSINDIYCVATKGGRAVIWAYLNGNEVGASAQKALNFQLDHWYHLKAVANGNNFEFYIDGELIASLSDSRHPTGRVGLAVNGAVAHFDNLVITGDDVPDNSGPSAISASGKLATRWGQLRRQ